MTTTDDVSARLWSESPRQRLEAARTLSALEAAALRKDVASTSPMKPWPYGMPTVVNPFLVVLGPSPGNSPQPGDVEFVEQRPYEEPTVGQVHPKFLYEDARGYWQKVRELSIGVLRGFDPELSAEECYSLSGQTNLGVGGFGRANKQAVDPTYARWVPRVVMEKLRPRIIIMLGLLSLLKDHEAIRRDFASSGLIRIDWKRPDREFRFEQYQQKKLLFRTWRISRPDGGVTTVVSWPNHPSRAPMTNVDLWRASIREGARYLAT